jgi:hypothetical protein
MTNPSCCPSEFTLERWRFGELAASAEEVRLVTHVAGCAQCRCRQATLAEGEQPSQDTGPLWSRVVAAGLAGQRKAKWRGRARLWQAGTLALAALSGLILFARRPAEDVLAKGPAWRLGVIAKAKDGKVMRVAPGAVLSPGDRLRFEVATTWPKGQIALLLLDSSGKVSRLAPAGQALAIAAGKNVLLDETVELDSALGPERIVLVACDHPLDVGRLVATAEHALSAAGGNPRMVSSLGTSCHEESFWITKVNK